MLPKLSPSLSGPYLQYAHACMCISFSFKFYLCVCVEVCEWGHPPLLACGGWRVTWSVGPHLPSSLRAAASSCSLPCVPAKLAHKFLNSPLSASLLLTGARGLQTRITASGFYTAPGHLDPSPHTWVALYPTELFPQPIIIFYLTDTHILYFLAKISI